MSQGKKYSNRDEVELMKNLQPARFGSWRDLKVEVQAARNIDYLLRIGEKGMGVNPKLAQHYMFDAVEAFRDK